MGVCEMRLLAAVAGRLLAWGEVFRGQEMGQGGGADAHVSPRITCAWRMPGSTTVTGDEPTGRSGTLEVTQMHATRAKPSHRREKGRGKVMPGGG